MNDREKKSGSLVDTGLNLIKAVTVIANDEASAVEKKEFCVKQAQLELDNRRARSDSLPVDFFGEPAWQMLLELYIAHYREEQFTVTNLCLASNEPQTTALRWIDILEGHGYVCRTSASYDKRLKIVSLSESAIDRLDHFFIERPHHLV